MEHEERVAKIKDEMKKKKDLQEAVKFLQSPRGQYIISQALCLAIKEINNRPKTEQEPSNVADMEYLVEALFPLYRAVEATKEELLQIQDPIA